MTASVREKLRRLIALAIVRREEESNEARCNEAAAAARAFFRIVRDQRVDVLSGAAAATSERRYAYQEPETVPARDGAMCWTCRCPIAKGSPCFAGRGKATTCGDCGPL